MHERHQAPPPADNPLRADAQDRPDHPPAHDEFPPGALVAIVDDMPAALEAADAARAVGGGDAYVLEAATVLREDAERRSAQGPVAKAVELLGSLVSDQRAIQDRYLEHAKAGHHMVVATAPDDVTAERVWAAVRDRGAHDGSWYGPGTIREML